MFSFVSASQKRDVKADEAAESMSLKPSKHWHLHLMARHQISLGSTIRKQEFLTSTVKNNLGAMEVTLRLKYCGDLKSVPQ